MYRVSPFTYLISAMMSVGLANQVVTCSSIEIARFQPPSGETCGSYMASYISAAGGAVYNPYATSNCEFCALTETNVFLKAQSSDYNVRWRNFGIMWVYIGFNVFGAVFLYWLVRVPKNSRKIKSGKEVAEEERVVPKQVEGKNE